MIKYQIILPILLILSSCAQTHLRSIASDQNIDQLEYPDFKFEEDKLKTVNTKLQFFRTFVPFYYSSMKKNVTKIKGINELKNITGWCTGDAHVENFGVLLNEKNIPQFTINDFDDSDQCPPILDLYRLLISANLESTVELIQLLSNYQLGLSQKYVPPPKIILNLLKESSLKGIKVNPKYIDGDYNFVRPDGAQDLTNDEFETLKNSISSKLKQTTIYDSYKITKQSGGSFGMNRFELLINNSKSKLVWIELKEETIPSIFYFTEQYTDNINKRMNKNFEIFLNSKSNQYYNTLQMNNKDYLIRPKFYGNQNIKIENFSQQDLVEIIQYEAYVLGSIHRKSLTNNIDEYLFRIKKNNENILDDINNLTTFFNDMYNKFKKNGP